MVGETEQRHLLASSDPQMSIVKIYSGDINALAATGRLVRLAATSWKMPCTSQSIFFIFHVVKLPLC